ncbi:uncharacterized protein LOC128266724 isoform X1 [Drosophila gunungcola]|uniref:Uncharacterized protein n=1 Tax=Drosophila gunungcola TaxID=103775 RepID=A0A9Q0BUF5_9MUSC|nr:uncharacterized protein LOC128266724 isoform X1 [Drosophila gunungcola]KAI8045092.1 hypothetical protein M5D96_001269 [Drosophila gunungcola]
MFLNEVGQPLILETGKKYGLFEEHRGALLLSSAAFKEHLVPGNWCKCVVGSEQDILRLRSQENSSVFNSENYKFKTIPPNRPTQIEYDGSQITITLIPAGKSESGFESTLYYIDNDHAKYLIVDRLSGYLDFLPKAHSSFHQGLREGIDVVFIDEDLLDGIDLNEDLYSLMDLIRPKFIYGLRLGELPKWLLNLRRMKYEY